MCGITELNAECYLDLSEENARVIKFDGVQTLLFYCDVLIIIMNQLHAVSRGHQGRQREPSVNYPPSAEFWRHCMLKGGS